MVIAKNAPKRTFQKNGREHTASNTRRIGTVVRGVNDGEKDKMGREKTRALGCGGMLQEGTKQL